MADGEHSLPPNEELFEQPMEQEPQQYELPRAEQDQGYHGVPEDPQASGGAPPHDMEHHYPVQEDHLANSGYYEPPPPTATNQVFQPTPQQNFVAPQPRDAQNYEEQGAGDAGGGGAAVNGEDPPGDADTVWIDSDSDDDPEAEFLRANFGLTYSDHNYDCPDPADRVIHPQEGPFKVIGGLSEDGRIVKEWMPDGYGPPHREGYVPTEEDEEEATAAATVKEEPLQQQHHPEYQSPSLQQQQVHPMRQTMRPVVAAQPFSIGGNQVEYAEPRMPPRGVSVAPRDTQFRIINELGHPMMASSQQHHGIRAQSVSSTRVLNNSPHATIIRQQPQHPQTLYQAPQGSLRGTPLQSQQQRLGGATPGSYQHIVNPSPSGNFGATIRRQVPAQGAPRGVGGPGIVVSSNQLGPRPGVRPVHVTRPMTDNLDREFIEHPMPLPPQGPPATAQIRRAPADVAPHRMTAEQRLEQQQLNRQRAQFPMQRGGVQQPQQQATTRVPAQQAAIIGRGRGGVMAVGSPGHEDLLRSPQRGIQERQPVVCEPRKFQVRVTDTYSAPIPKASDQLPAQLTEDPPEEVQKVEEPTDEAPEASEVKQEIKSPSRLTSATSSPVKSHGIQQKPTPPHRMTQEEKNAHLAKLSTDKEKPTNLNTLPLRGVHHQDDTLAVVQSVFESNKPRQPDTPKDKEAISKIADLLRFSAEEFSGASGSGTSNTRQRSISGGANRAQNYGSAPMVQPHHQPHLHHQQQQPPPNPMDDEARRKRHGSGRYDNNMGIGGQNPMHQMRSPAHIQQQQQAGEPEPNLDPPIRPRGRPRGTTQQRVARFGNAPETLAPHRAAGGARTLPPRQVQQHQEPPAPPPRAAISANSDSESEAVDSESWEMRCHCDMDHGDGETVECESCKTWQHMACMGLNMNSDTTKYKCEVCQPRRLPVTKAEAIRTQKKILEKLRRATERERRNKRKSEPVEPVKPVVQQSRKSAPMPLQPQPAPQSHRIAQLNEYSRQATALLNSMQQTAGADQLLEESRRHNKARRMFVEENVEALVTMELVQIRQVILEVNGYVAMSNEMKRQPGGGNCIFMYDGLMKGTAGEDMGSGQELVCIDTKKKGNDTKFTRRSCIPNCVLKHVLGSQATLGIMVVATKDILRNTEVTLPFDADWKESDVPLDCAEHMRDIHSCPFEQERRRAAGDRQRVKDTEKRRIEEAKRADEERRRLEEEVRRERAAKTKQLEEEAEKERLELERAEKERKAKEREEAKKKREQEKKKEQEKEGSSSKQPEGITSRDALRVQQAEERFRRQEEEEKRREARRSRSKSQTPKPEDVPTSSDSAVPSTSDSQANRRQSSRNQQKKEMPEKVETPEVKEAPAAEDTPTTSGTRSSKRMKTPAAIFVAASAASSAAKKPRYSTAVRVEPTTTISPAPNVTRKRGAAASSLTPAAKRANAGRPEPPMYRLGDLAQEMNENAAVNSMVLEFEPPERCTDESSVSDWAKEAKANEEVLKAKKAAKSSSSSSSKPVEPPPKKAATPIAKKKDVAAAPEVVDTSKTPRRRGEVKEAPKTVEIAAKEKPSEAAPEDKNVAGPAPPPARAASPKKSAAKPVEKPEKPSEIHGMEREASESAEGSVEKELTPTTPSAAKKAPKKLTLADYATRRSKREEPGTSAASAPSPSSASTSTRRGFIPSTDGLGGNVQLSAIPLDNHPANASITTTAPSHQPPPPPPPASSSAVSITSPSTRSRARAAASESADETPAEHQMSLIDRITHMFGDGIVAAPAAAAAPPPPPPQSSNDTSNSSRPRTRPTRWNV